MNRNEVLTALSSLKLRAEKQPATVDDLETFVHVIDFATIGTPNTHLIYGRNGTGKTHLLRAFHRSCEREYGNKRLLAIYVDFKDLDLGPVLPQISVDDLLLRFYRQFVRTVVLRLKDFADAVITVDLLEKFFGGESRDRKESVEDSIRDLETQLSPDHVEEKVRQFVRKVEEKRERAAGGGVKAAVGVDKGKIVLSGGLDVSAENRAKQQETVELILDGLAVIDYQRIRKGLENIITQTGATAIIVLVDEWSSVSLPVQPLLAEMIRKTLGSSNKVFLKIAALKYLTQTSREVGGRQRIGLQLGVDVVPLADLDQLQSFESDPNAVKDFLTMVAFKHARAEYRALGQRTVKGFEDYVCTEVFGSQEAYLEVVRSSEGNPRDFMSILASCCATAKAGGQAKISEKQSVRAASRYFTEGKAAEIKANPAAEALFKSLFQRVVKNGEKVFAISAAKGSSDDRVEYLWHYRFIHLLDPNYAVLDENGIPAEYAVYSMDYGKLLSLKVEAAGERIVNAMREGADRVCAVLGLGGLLRLALRGLMAEMGGGLSKMAGPVVASQQGVERAESYGVGNLIPKCVVDDLL